MPRVTVNDILRVTHKTRTGISTALVEKEIRATSVDDTTTVNGKPVPPGTWQSVTYVSSNPARDSWYGHGHMTIPVADDFVPTEWGLQSVEVIGNKPPEPAHDRGFMCRHPGYDSMH